MSALTDTHRALALNSSARHCTVPTGSNAAATYPIPVHGAEPSMARFSRISGHVMSSASETVDTESAPEADVVRELNYTVGWDIDSGAIAALLSRVECVDAIYVSDSVGQTHVWTLVRDDNEAALDAIFERELELHDCFGRRLASVEFHVVSREAEDALGAAEKVFEREL